MSRITVALDVNEPRLPRVVSRILLSDEKFGLRLQKLIDGADENYHRRAEDFFRRYDAFMQSLGRSFEFGIDCFIRLQRSVENQRAQFLQTGRYANTSFEEVNRNVYSNAEVMEYHMHGLVFAQFLWPDQYRRFQFFSDKLPEYAGGIRRYLEIGGGHGLYVAEAARILAPEVPLEVVDISPTSIQMAHGIAQEPRIQYHLMNVFDFSDGPVYDFITMGEVLEHVEDPQTLLSKLRRLLTPGGRVYLTTPANAPMLDHIYLFQSAQQIRDMIHRCGFAIEAEIKQYAVDIPDRRAEQMKIPLMYGAFLSVPDENSPA